VAAYLLIEGSGLEDGSSRLIMDVLMTETLDEVIGWCSDVDENTLSRRQTILFVEDEAFVREVTCEVLRAAGYRVLTAKNATEAMRIYEARGDEVELLISDVVLPGESGRVLAGKLRRENPWLKILLVTGYTEQMGPRGTMQEEYLAKPFSTEVLLGRVRQLLDRAGLPIGAEDLLTHACGSV
jgi:DNA-binding response OmpR family regulator